MRIRTATVYCAHFANFANVSTRIARTLREHMLLASLHEVFVCVSLPFFGQVPYLHKYYLGINLNHGCDFKTKHIDNFF